MLVNRSLSVFHYLNCLQVVFFLLELFSSEVGLLHWNNIYEYLILKKTRLKVNSVQCFLFLIISIFQIFPNLFSNLSSFPSLSNLFFIFSLMLLNWKIQYSQYQFIFNSALCKKRPINRLTFLLGYRIARSFCHVNTNLW